MLPDGEVGVEHRLRNAGDPARPGRGGGVLSVDRHLPVHRIQFPGNAVAPARFKGLSQRTHDTIKSVGAVHSQQTPQPTPP